MKAILQFLIGLALGFALGYTLVTFLPPEVGGEQRLLVRQRVEEAVAEGKRASTERQRELREHLERAKQGTA